MEALSLHKKVLPAQQSSSGISKIKREPPPPPLTYYGPTSDRAVPEPQSLPLSRVGKFLRNIRNRELSNDKDEYEMPVLKPQVSLMTLGKDKGYQGRNYQSDEEAEDEVVFPIIRKEAIKYNLYNFRIVDPGNPEPNHGEALVTSSEGVDKPKAEYRFSPASPHN